MTYLVGGLEHEFHFSIQLGIIIPPDEYFSEGLKPPTSYSVPKKVHFSVAQLVLHKPPFYDSSFLMETYDKPSVCIWGTQKMSFVMSCENFLVKLGLFSTWILCNWGGIQPAENVNWAEMSRCNFHRDKIMRRSAPRHVGCSFPHDISTKWIKMVDFILGGSPHDISTKWLVL